MPRPDIVGDANRIVEVLLDGGVIINPGDLGYGMLTASPGAARKSFEAKQRAPHKRHGMLGSADIRAEVHQLDRRGEDIVNAITVDFDLPLGVVAPVRMDHPLIKAIDPETFRGASVDGTMAMVQNNGKLCDELSRLSLEHGVPFLGSSANLTGTGVKYRLEDIEDEVRQSADLEINYGLCKYHTYQRSSTMINFVSMSVIRIGACYELISDILQRYFAFECPPDPGRDVLPHGHLWEPEAASTSPGA
jgi:tRNA A37 threonylcarbamoyladenosine synthetase subunit TsaC/SUA5/YrdC